MMMFVLRLEEIKFDGSLVSGPQVESMIDETQLSMKNAIHDTIFWKAAGFHRKPIFTGSTARCRDCERYSDF
jgi:hypothetical protein